MTEVTTKTIDLAGDNVNHWVKLARDLGLQVGLLPKGVGGGGHHAVRLTGDRNTVESLVTFWGYDLEDVLDEQRQAVDALIEFGTEGAHDYLRDLAQIVGAQAFMKLAAEAAFGPDAKVDQFDQTFGVGTSQYTTFTTRVGVSTD